jgi:ATP-dependent 26S proteasome regulatory subunit
MPDRTVQRERAQNLWMSFARKHVPVSKAAELHAEPTLDFSRIGGLESAKDEVSTYACAATHPKIYERWGTAPPTAILLLGRRGVGKSLLAEALATEAGTAFLNISVPRLVIEIVHREPKAAELLEGWTQVLSEMPPVTVFFDELEFSQAQEIGIRRPDFPIGPIMDFLLELIDQAIAPEHTLVVGATSHPGALRQAFLASPRFERVIEVNPIYPDDVVEALKIHATDAEKRAGRTLFEHVDWPAVVRNYRDPPPGDWVQMLHAALRRKARCDAAGEEIGLVTTRNLLDEVERVRVANAQLRPPRGGNYL